MMVMLPIIISLFVFYSCLILYYWRSWIAIPEYQPTRQQQQLTISVIIPARNEEGNIKSLLDSLMQQNYPRELTEIIVVDDHSTDGTAAIVSQYSQVILVQLKNETINSYKKKAIETGIAHATGELIVTTDADCEAGADWLATIADFKTATQSAFIAAPVCFVKSRLGNSQLLFNFQLLDFMVLQGITGAAVATGMLSMCNGANLGYDRTAFYEVEGFSGIDHIASGDDMLLMHKIKQREPERVHYLKSKSAIVYTQAMGSWTEFYHQRIRWASKAGKFEDRKIYWVLLLVYLFNFSFLVLLIAGLWNHSYWWWLTGLWIGKTLVEFPFISSVAGFFQNKSILKYFFFFQPLHIVYTLVAGWLGQFGKYEWKGRKVN